MKIRIFAVLLALASTALCVRAANPTVDALVVQLQANPSGAPALVAQAIAANRSLAGDIFKAAYAALPDQTIAIMTASIAAVPSTAPIATQYAITQLTKGAAADAAAATAASVTKTAIDTALPTQSTVAAQNKLVAAIAGAAARALPGAAGLVEQTAAQAAPGASTQIHTSVQAALDFPPQPPPVVVSPST